jgi:TPR repeat protein
LKEALKYYRLAADQGDVESQMHFALCSYRGEGTPKNLIEAARYFKHASDNNDADAHVILGIFNFFGVGCCVDLAAAEDLFRMAADQGHVHGQFNYAISRLRHVESDHDRQDISGYFKSSADQGCVFAEVNYGVCLFRGLGVPADFREAARYFGNASRRGDEHGSFNYGVCLFEGKGVSIDRNEAFRCFEILAKENDACGLVNVGYCLHSGFGTTQNRDESLKCFKAAAALGNAIGQFNYGICCYRGEGTCVDLVEAFAYFKKSSNQNYPPAQLAIGFCLLLGRGIPRDRDYAHHYFRLAVESGLVVKDDWDQLRRIESPINVLSLSGSSLLESDTTSASISLSLGPHAESYFKRVDAFSGLPFYEWNVGRRKKKARIDAENRADSPIDLDDFRQVEILGSGTFGVVKLMVNDDGERYAVKFFTRTWHQTEETASAAFSREFEACCKLNHPCIVPVYGFSAATRQSGAALVMKYMESGSLADVLERVKRGKPPSFWTPTGIAIIVTGIVCGLEFIHSKGFVHRDLKPANFLVDEDGRCYVGDLGSSRLLEGVTHLSDDKSTIAYAAPELYDREYNSKVDVFSFGLILYEVVVGRAVYAGQGHSEHRVMYMAVNNIRAELPPDMSSDVKSLITRCWSGDRDCRPSFSDVLIELERIEFKILADVDSAAVKRFVSDVRRQLDKK